MSVLDAWWIHAANALSAPKAMSSFVGKGWSELTIPRSIFIFISCSSQINYLPNLW